MSMLTASYALAVETYTCRTEVQIKPFELSKLLTINVNGSPVNEGAYTCIATKEKNGPLFVHCKLKDSPNYFIGARVSFDEDAAGRQVQEFGASSGGSGNWASIWGYCTNTQAAQKDMLQSPFSSSR